jgi:hypothetical protein
MSDKLTEEEFYKLSQQWFDTGIVPIKLLHIFNGVKSEALANYIEPKIVNDFLDVFNGHPVKLHTQGNSPEFDIQLKNGTKIEIKVFGYNSRNKKTFEESGYTAFIETHQEIQGELVPSGLLLSEADYYLMLNPGSIQKTPCLKVRVISTEVLKSFFYALGNKQTVGNARGFYIRFNDLYNDGWVGSYPFDPEDNSFDSNNPVIAHKSIRKLKCDTDVYGNLIIKL